MHYWVTFLIIPLVLLVCLWLIKYLTKISEMPLLFTLRNPQKLTKINFVFFSESEIAQRFQNCSGFCCSSNETKTTEAVSFFLNWPIIKVILYNFFESFCAFAKGKIIQRLVFNLTPSRLYSTVFTIETNVTYMPFHSMCLSVCLSHNFH